MCGIPMLPPSDAARGRKLTFEQVIAHLGGIGNLITENGRRLIDLKRRDYIWKYPGHGYCTYCGGDVGDMKARHNAEVTCPACGRAVIFKHESRGHSRIFEQFCLYEWRRSAIDPEAIALTAAHVWRDSTRDRPEESPLRIHPSAVYIFRLGKAVTVYKNHRWGSSSGETPEGWDRMDNVAPDHTEYMGGGMEIVMDQSCFEDALRDTRVGRLFDQIRGASNRRDDLELMAIANCARRPWLEYLAKSGQGALAAELMRMRNIPREIIPSQRAKTPRQLLGMTEAQWHEVRRDSIRLTSHILHCMAALRRMGMGNLHMAEVLEIVGRGKSMAGYELDQLAPSDRRTRWHIDTAGDILIAEGVPEKLRRKVYRKATRDLAHASEWRDYFVQLKRLGEDFTDTALVLPRDMRAMHQRMIERENAIRDAQALKDLAGQRAKLEKWVAKLKPKYCFHAHGLVLRPYETAEEILREGRELHICIGSYAKRYAEGGTVICCLRREEEPDEPWRAIEFSAATGRLVQDRGMYNDTRRAIEPGTRKQLKLFWEAFERRNSSRAAARRAGAGA